MAFGCPQAWPKREQCGPRPQWRWHCGFPTRPAASAPALHLAALLLASSLSQKKNNNNKSSFSFPVDAAAGSCLLLFFSLLLWCLANCTSATRARRKRRRQSPPRSGLRNSQVYLPSACRSASNSNLGSQIR